MKVNCFLLLGFLLFSSGCIRSDMTPAAYMAWAAKSDNGLSVEKTVDDIKVSLLYQPHEYLVLREQRGNVPGPSEFESLVKEKEGFTYFLLRISPEETHTPILKTHLSSNGEYSERLSYYSYQLQKDIFMVEGLDTIRTVLYHFEPPTDLTPFVNISLAFELSEEQLPDQTFVMENKYLGIGPIKIHLSQISFSSIPSLKIH